MGEVVPFAIRGGLVILVPLSNNWEGGCFRKKSNPFGNLGRNSLKGTSDRYSKAKRKTQVLFFSRIRKRKRKARSSSGARG